MERSIKGTSANVAIYQAVPTSALSPLSSLITKLPMSVEPMLALTFARNTKNISSNVF